MQNQLTQAMVLTAGMSTRMRPLTNDIPKILLPCIGKNLFERMLDYVEAQGITSVAMNVFHGKEPLLQEASQSKHKVKVVPYQESPIRGTGGGILGMKSFIKSDHFAVINCDFLTEAVLGNMFKFHVQQKALATLLLTPVPKTGKYGTVQMDTSRKIKSFHPQTPQRNIFAGIHIMSKEIFEHFPEDHNFCIIENVYKKLVEKGAPIYAFQKPVVWHDLGEVKLYHDSLFALLQKPIPWMTDIKLGKSWIDSSLKVPSSVSYLNTILEKNVQFEGPCQFKNTIVFPRTIVKPGLYENMILTPTDSIKT